MAYWGPPFTESEEGARLASAAAIVEAWLKPRSFARCWCKGTGMMRVAWFNGSRFAASTNKLTSKTGRHGWRFRANTDSRSAFS